jgi:hypothetical protein
LFSLKVDSKSMQELLAGIFLGLLAILCCGAELRLPEPPRQNRRWHAPPGVPTNFLVAATTLFQQGFPDPRGCEYRDITVAVSTVWGNTSQVKTRGFVLPKKSSPPGRFAICWNGLVYPIMGAGARADVHAEVTNLASARIPYWLHNSGVGEWATVTFSNAATTRNLLLLKCGETDAAKTLWAEDENGMIHGRRYPNEKNDPYITMAGDWSWAMFDRTLCAHMQGDEKLALASARQLAGVKLKIEEEFARRKLPAREQPLTFLSQLPQLLTDLERRDKEGPHVSCLKQGGRVFTNQIEKINALIRDLDLVEARQWGQPGGVDLAEDPIVKAITDQGDAAIPALLDCLEKDERLTRSVSFPRDFFRARTVIPVRSAAMTAVQMILHAGLPGDVTAIRAFWDKYKNLPLEGRWYAMLQDDAAPDRWLEAAGNIVEASNVVRNGFFTATTPMPGNQPAPMRGEKLRRKTNPTVSELMARRALEVPHDDPGKYDIAKASEMGVRLSAWDPKAAGPVVRALSKRCRSVMEHSGQQLGTWLVDLSLARARAGDPEAFDDYAAWLVTTTPDQMQYGSLKILEPLEKFPTNATLESAAEKIFGPTNSSWAKLPWKQAGADDPLKSSLVDVSAFRRLLARELDRKDPWGSVEWDTNGYIRFKFPNSSGSVICMFPGSSQLTNGTKTDIRQCDWRAIELAGRKEFEPFNPFAPVARRDETLQKFKACLLR